MRERVDPREQRGRLGREPLTIGGETEIRVGRPHREDQVQARLDEALRRGVRGEPCRRHPPRSFPQYLDRPAQRGFELLRSHGKEQRQDRVGQDTCVEEIGPGEAQFADADLEGGVVPQRDGHSLVWRQAVIEANAGGNLRGTHPGHARRGARALLQPAGRALEIDRSPSRARRGESQREHGDAKDRRHAGHVAPDYLRSRGKIGFTFQRM